MEIEDYTMEKTGHGENPRAVCRINIITNSFRNEQSKKKVFEL